MQNLLISLTNQIHWSPSALIFVWSIMIMLTQSFYTITFFSRPHQPNAIFQTMFVVLFGCQILALNLIVQNDVITLVDIAGLGLSFLGMSLFFYSVFSLRAKQLNVAFSNHHSDRLVQHGAFAVVRHPFYTSYLILWGCIALFSHSVLGIVPFFAMLPFYVWAARQEEHALLAKELGEAYKAYQQRTGMFIPKPGQILSICAQSLHKITQFTSFSLTKLQVVFAKTGMVRERKMTQPKSFNIWSAKFADKSMEKKFMAASVVESGSYHAIMMIVATGFFASYGLIDLKTLEYGSHIAFIRVCLSLLVIAAVLITMKTKRHHQLGNICLIGMTAFGLLITYSIFIEQDPMNEYYKGILQITVIGSIVLRMEFLKWAISLTIIFAAFWLSTVGIFEGQRYSNILLFLASTSLTCALGVYNIELTRRRAFLMRVDIQQKSDKLVEMNAREVQSAKSKNAMINILAHFYNTPIHQIKGFSELLQSSGDTLDEDTSAGYLDQIINSTVSLNRFTQKVLEYNTLPEVPKVADFTTVSIGSILKPAIDDASALTTCKTDIDDFKITGPADQLTMIMTSLVDNIAEHAGDVSLISITALIENDIARIEISDNGTGLTTAQFAESVLPFQELTKFMAMGEKVPMGLRYAEKVLNMLGGEIQAIEGLAGTKLQLTFPAIYDAQNDPWLEHEQATA